MKLAAERGVADRFAADSCGTGSWHVGEPPDPRALLVAQRNGLSLSHRARVLNADRDFDRFDWLLAMDRANLAEILRRGGPADRARLLRSFEPGICSVDEPGIDVPDPYSGGPRDFDRVYSIVVRACGGLLEALLAR